MTRPPYRFPDPRGWRRELKKQLGDQALHWLWGVLTGALPLVLARWFGPAVWAPAAGVSALSLVVMAVREWLQLRNGTDRWWDAPLDWGFLALGVRDGLALGAVILWCL